MSTITIKERGIEIKNVKDHSDAKRTVPIKEIRKLKISQETVMYLPKGIDKIFPKLNNLMVSNCD